MKKKQLYTYDLISLYGKTTFPFQCCQNIEAEIKTQIEFSLVFF